MRKREREPLEKHCINLFKGDLASMQDLHPRLGAGRAIRDLVRGHILRAKEVAEGKKRTINLGEVEIQ